MKVLLKICVGLALLQLSYYSYFQFTGYFSQDGGNNLPAETCPKFVCTTRSSAANKTESQCAFYDHDDNTYYVRACALDGYEC
jgi:hypothetical protein